MMHGLIATLLAFDVTLGQALVKISHRCVVSRCQRNFITRVEVKLEALIDGVEENATKLLHVLLLEALM
jgi:hypothetical protein